MKKLLLILLTCTSALGQTSLSPLTLRLSDFPQSSPADTVQIFSRNYAATDGLAGLVWRMENSGFAGLFPTTDNFSRMSLGHIQPLTTLDIRGTPQANSGLLYMNDQHTFTGSSGIGPLIYGAVGQQLAWAVGVKDNITPDNAYNVDFEGLPGVINGTSTRNLRFGVVGTNTTYYPLLISHTGFVSVGVGSGANGVLTAIDGNLVLQADTNSAGLGGQVSLEPSPTRPLVLAGGLKHNFRSAAATTTVATNDYFVLATSSINVTNMDASDVLSGRIVWVGADSGDTATIIPQAGDTINGASDYELTSGWVGLVSDGTSNWQIFGATAAPSAGGYDTIEEEGTPLAQESVLNFIGSTLTAAAGSGETTVTSDSDVDALASNSSNGLWTRTGSGTGSARTITAGSGISVADGDGVSGNPTITATGISIDSSVLTKTLIEDPDPGDGTDVFEVSLPSETACSLLVQISIVAQNGTDFESYTTEVKLAAVNIGGTINIDKRVGSDGIANAPPGTTMVVTYPDFGDSDSFMFRVNASTDITTPTITMKYSIKNLTGQTITPL